MATTDAGAATALNALGESIVQVGAYNGAVEVSTQRQPYSFPATAGKTLASTTDVELTMPDASQADTLRFFDANGAEQHNIALSGQVSNPAPGNPWTLRIDSAAIIVTP